MSGSASNGSHMQTHNIPLVLPISQFVVSVHDGKITSQGSIDDALRVDASILNAPTDPKPQKTEEPKESTSTQADVKLEMDESGRLVAVEEVAEGWVGMAAGAYIIHS